MKAQNTRPRPPVLIHPGTDDERRSNGGTPQASGGWSVPLCCLSLITLSLCADGVKCQDDEAEANITDAPTTAGSGEWSSKPP